MLPRKCQGKSLALFQDVGEDYASRVDEPQQPGLSSVHSEPNLQHTPRLNSGDHLPNAFDLGELEGKELMFHVMEEHVYFEGSSLDNGEQMDWLDLILPSPAGLDLPPNHPGSDPDQCFLGSDREGSPMETRMHHHPSSYIGGGPGNPVLAQNAVCRSGTGAACYC